jgi:hypothetical protein
VLRFTTTQTKTFILLDKNFSDHSPLYLLVGASLSVIGGIFGLLALAFNIQFMFHLVWHQYKNQVFFVFFMNVFFCILQISHFSWLIVTMCLCSSITARGNLVMPTISTYYRLFEAASLFSQDPSYLQGSWPHIQPNIWDDMQKSVDSFL